jgi:hypothetical protein
MRDIQREESSLDKRALKRTGISAPVCYDKLPRPPALDQAMQVLWDIGKIDSEGRADAELRRPYHMIAKGRAPLTEADVIRLGQKRNHRGAWTASLATSFHLRSANSRKDQTHA